MAVNFGKVESFKRETRGVATEAEAAELAEKRARELAALEVQNYARQLKAYRDGAAQVVQRAFRGYFARRYTLPGLREELRQLSRWSLDAVFEAVVRRQNEFGLAIDDALRRKQIQKERRVELRTTLKHAARRVGEAAVAMKATVDTPATSFLAVVAAARDRAATQAVLSGSGGASRHKARPGDDGADSEELEALHKSRTRVDLAAMLRALDACPPPKAHATDGNAAPAGASGGKRARRASGLPTLGVGMLSGRQAVPPPPSAGSRTARSGASSQRSPRHAASSPRGSQRVGFEDSDDDDETATALGDDDDITSVVERMDEDDDLGLGTGDGPASGQAAGARGAGGASGDDFEAGTMRVAAALRDAAELGVLLDPEVARLSAAGASVALVEDRGFYFRRGVSEGAFVSFVRDCGLWGNRASLGLLRTIFVRRCTLATDQAATVHARRQFFANCGSSGRLPRERIWAVVAATGLPVPAAEAADWAGRQASSITVEAFTSWFQERRAQAKSAAIVAAGGRGGSRGLSGASASFRRQRKPASAAKRSDKLAVPSFRVANALEAAGQAVASAAGGREDALFGALVDGQPPPLEALVPLCCLTRDGFERALADLAVVLLPETVTGQRPPLDFDDALEIAGQDPDGAPQAEQGRARGAAAGRAAGGYAGSGLLGVGGGRATKASARRGRLSPRSASYSFGPEPPSAVALMHMAGSSARREALERILRERIAPAVHQMEVLGCWGLASPAGALLQSEGVRMVLREYESGLLTIFARYAEAPVLANSQAGKGVARRPQPRGGPMNTTMGAGTMLQSQEGGAGVLDSAARFGWLPSSGAGADDLHVPGGHARHSWNQSHSRHGGGSDHSGSGLASASSTGAGTDGSSGKGGGDAGQGPFGGANALLAAPSFLMRSEVQTDDPAAQLAQDMEKAGQGKPQGGARFSQASTRTAMSGPAGARGPAATDTSIGEAAGLLRTSGRVRYGGWRRLCSDFGLHPGLLANGVEDGFELLSCLLSARARDRVGMAHECVYPPVALFGALRRRCAKCGRAEYRWAYDEQVATRAAFRSWTKERGTPGRLPKSEVRALLASLGRQVPPASAAFRLMLAVMNEDRRGVVGMDDFMEGLEAAETMAQTARGAAVNFPELCVSMAVAARMCMSKPAMREHLPPSPPPATQLRFLLSHVMEPVFRAATGETMRRCVAATLANASDPGLPAVEVALARELSRAHFLYSRLDGEVTGERLDAGRFLLFARDLGLFRSLPVQDIMRVFVAAATERLRAGDVLDIALSSLADARAAKAAAADGQPSDGVQAVKRKAPPAPIRRAGSDGLSAPRPPAVPSSPRPPARRAGDASGGGDDDAAGARQRLRAADSFRVMSQSEDAAGRLLRGTKATIGTASPTGVANFPGGDPL
ncbi:hypothetical protein FNF31_00662 [Cafeteria roenbergensis]|uniref:EF-hand domain-containing protein n=1 Tax=Cafeteria roenbergensis TaxID=33653 RepID=A0A5A8DSW7_CAFRO|nr:hypothetical protein FNF31_00662 [Cafeteria roenbergensis]